MESDAITDAASELVALADFLKSVRQNVGGEKTYVSISAALRVPPESFESLELISVVGSRIFDFSEFIRNVEDPFLTPRVREHALQSLSLFSRIFSPSMISADWHNTKANCLNDRILSDIESLRYISSKFRPLRKLTDQERTDAIEVLEKIITGEALRSLPLWANLPLTQGALKLKRTLQYISFFGHDMAIDALVQFSQRARATEEILSHKEGASKTASAGIKGIIVATVLLVDIFCVPHQMNEAYKTYKGWMVESEKIAIGSQKSLPPPAALLIEDKSQEEI